MSAVGWYLRDIDPGAFTRRRREAGAGWFNPAVIVCSCGWSAAFEWHAAQPGEKCWRCGEEVLSEEQCRAAAAALALGGNYGDALTVLLGIPQLDDSDKSTHPGARVLPDRD